MLSKRLLFVLILCGASYLLLATADLDHDGLPDPIEKILTTSPNHYDSDGDGYSDHIECLQGSHPLDTRSVPGNFSDQLWSCAWQDAPGGDVKVHLSMYPKTLLGSLEVYAMVDSNPLGSYEGEITQIHPDLSKAKLLANGSATILFQIAEHLPHEWHDLENVALGFVAGSSEDDAVVDRLVLSLSPDDFGTQNLERVIGPAGPAHMTTTLNPDQPENHKDENPKDKGKKRNKRDPAHCKTRLGEAKPEGDAAIKYKIVSANCEDGLGFCVQVKCEERIGEEVIQIDYGVLRGKKKKKQD